MREACVILACVTRLGFVGLAFVLNALLGNVCLVGTAYAANPIDDAVETLLSREVPMSFNVITCTWVKTEEGWEPTADSPCASGKCLKNTSPETSCLASVPSERVPMALSDPPGPQQFVPWTDAIAIHPAAERPPILVGVESVVLRM